MKRIFDMMVLLVFCGLFLAGNAWSAPVEYNGHYYELTTVSGGWAACEQEAEADGGHLVTINDAAEETWLISQFGTYRFWIGFTDEAAEGNWVWVSGDSVTYTNWAGQEPNNSTPPDWGEDYAIMNWSGNNWNDWDEYRYDFPSGGYQGIVELTGSPVPVPATLILLAPGLAGLAALRRRFQK